MTPALALGVALAAMTATVGRLNPADGNDVGLLVRYRSAWAWRRVSTRLT